MSHNLVIRYSFPTLETHRIQESLSSVLDVALIDQVASKFVASLTQEALKAFNGRLERGLELAKNGSVQPLPNSVRARRFLVRSSDGWTKYTVDLDTKTCDCPDSLKGHTCKHRVAAYYIEQMMKLVNAAQTAKVPEAKAAPNNTPKQPVEPIPVKKVPTQVTKPAPEVAWSREEQLLAELGFAPEPQKVREVASSPSVQLGSLYRRYLHGTDLGQQALPVTIQNITKEKVCPHPSQPVIEKWCLWVYGLPDGMPNGILFGSRGEEDLLAIFGNVSLDDLKGKMVVVYAKPMNVAGQEKLSIRFRRAL